MNIAIDATAAAHLTNTASEIEVPLTMRISQSVLGDATVRQFASGKFLVEHPVYGTSVLSSRKAVFNRLKGFRERAERGLPACSNPKQWSTLEIQKLRIAWGRLSKDNLLKALPGRSYFAIKSRARDLGLRASQSAVQRRRLLALGNDTVWTLDESELLLRNAENRPLWPKLFPNRTVGACATRLYELGHRPGNKNRFNDGEDRLVTTILNAREALLQTRSERSILKRLQRVGTERAQRKRIAAAIHEATATLKPEDIREEVRGELFVKVLSKEITLSDLAAAVKTARTHVYGRRMYSLDAPLSDGSGMTWLDTIASDREHF